MADLVPVRYTPTAHRNVVDPTLKHLAETRPAVTDLTVSDRPVRLYFERPRIAWLPTAGRVLMILGPVVTVVFLAAMIMGWAVGHWLQVSGMGMALLSLALVKVISRRRTARPAVLARTAGHDCSGLHCDGCRGRR